MNTINLTMPASPAASVILTIPEVLHKVWTEGHNPNDSYDEGKTTSLMTMFTEVLAAYSEIAVNSLIVFSRPDFMAFKIKDDANNAMVLKRFMMDELTLQQTLDQLLINISIDSEMGQVLIKEGIDISFIILTEQFLQLVYKLIIHQPTYVEAENVCTTAFELINNTVADAILATDNLPQQIQDNLVLSGTLLTK